MVTTIEGQKYPIKLIEPTSRNSRFLKSQYDLVVMVESSRETNSNLKVFSKRALQATSALKLQAHVLLAKDREFEPKQVEEFQKQVEAGFFGDNVSGLVINDAPQRTSIFIYGLLVAANQSKRVVEIDAKGGHNPNDLADIYLPLMKHDVSLSSRNIPGAQNTYPLQRKLVSHGATLLSNLFLETKLTDASSGYEGFNSHVLKRLFTVIPPEQWHSLNYGPFHMFQTEIRAKLAWIPNLTWTEVPIIYGKEKQGAILPISYITQSLLCFYHLWVDKEKLKRRLAVR